jgi:hypothetical protein
MTIPFGINYVKSKEVLLFGGLFIFYACFIQGLLVAYLQDIMLIFPILFWIYNYTLFYSVQVVFYKTQDYFIEKLKKSIEITAIMQVLLYVVTAWPHYDVGRQTIFFNNPNQLGYFALTMASLYELILSRYNVGRKILSHFIFGCFGFMAILSLSKAGMASFLILILFRMADKPKNIFKFIIISLLCYSVFSTTSYYKAMVDRMELIGSDSDDGLSARGYDRIINNPEYLIFGAGGGGVERFDSAINLEIHSTFGTLLFSYGIVGFCLFAIFIYKIIKYSDAKNFLYLIPIAIYGLTHNGLRFSPAWILLSIVLVIPKMENKTRIVRENNLINNESQRVRTVHK